jgi:TetR/AcrR family transcriptional regulator
MLYHYFGGKELLYLAVLEQSYAAIRAAEAGLDLGHRPPREAMRELVLFTWHYFLAHPEFLSLLGTENLMRGRFVKKSERAVIMNSPIIAELRDVLARGSGDGVFRAGLDPLDIYITIAALGFFYLSNRWTLSAAFARDLMDPAELARWEAHIVEVMLSYLTPPKP